MNACKGSEPQIFSHPKSWGFGFGIGFPVVVGFGVVMVVAPIAVRSPFAVLLVPFGLWALVAAFATLWLLPSRITVSKEVLSSRNYIGRSKHVRWEDISRIYEGSANSFHYKHLVRVTDARQGRSIVFTDAISNFSELRSVLDERALDARELPVSLGWRLLLGGV